MKRPAAHAAQKGEEKAATEEPKPKGAIPDHRVAKREVAQTRRLIAKLEGVRASLAEKTRANGAELRKALQKLEEVDAKAKKTGRAVSRVNAAKREAKLEVKAARALKSRAAATKAGDISKLRANSARVAWKLAQEKHDANENERKKLQAVIDMADKQCKALKAKGNDVPERGDTSDWQYSHPSVVLAPGIMAAKARHFAIEALAKKEKEWGKVAKVAAAKMERYRGVKDKLKKAHDMCKAADDVLSDIALPPKRKLKAKAAAKANGKGSAKRKAHKR